MANIFEKCFASESDCLRTLRCIRGMVSSSLVTLIGRTEVTYIAILCTKSTAKGTDIYYVSINGFSIHDFPYLPKR